MSWHDHTRVAKLCLELQWRCRRIGIRLDFQDSHKVFQTCKILPINLPLSAVMTWTGNTSGQAWEFAILCGPSYTYKCGNDKVAGQIHYLCQAQKWTERLWGQQLAKGIWHLQDRRNLQYWLWSYISHHRGWMHNNKLYIQTDAPTRQGTNFCLQHKLCPDGEKRHKTKANHKDYKFADAIFRRIQLFGNDFHECHIEESACTKSLLRFQLRNLILPIKLVLSLDSRDEKRAH